MVGSVVEGSQDDFVQTSGDAALDALEDVGAVPGHDFLEGPEDLGVPVATGLLSGGVGPVQDVQDAANHAHIGAEAGLVGGVAAPGMVKVDVEAQGQVDFHRSPLDESQRARRAQSRRTFVPSAFSAANTGLEYLRPSTPICVLPVPPQAVSDAGTGVEAAVHRNHHARHEGAGRRGQPDHRPNQVLRRPEAPHRGVGQNGLPARGKVAPFVQQEVAVLPGEEKARRDGVDPNAG